MLDWDNYDVLLFFPTHTLSLILVIVNNILLTIILLGHIGSICNISNAQVAKKLNCPVLLIGKSGVGDAVDSYNLNSTYFSAYQVKVLGGIFNKIPLDGYYSLEYCSVAITSYFQQYRSYEMPYGYIPILQDDDDDALYINENVFIPECHGVNDDIAKNDYSDYRNDHNINGTKDTAQSKHNTNLQHMNKKRSSSMFQFTSFEWKLSDAFIEHVDIQRLMHDLWCYEVIKHIRIYNIYI